MERVKIKLSLNQVNKVTTEITTHTNMKVDFSFRTIGDIEEFFPVSGTL